VAKHRLEGPILDVTCDVARDDRELVRAHPGAPVVRYSCLAVTFRARTSPPTQIGTPFVARVDFARGRYAWCLFTPRRRRGRTYGGDVQRQAAGCVRRSSADVG